MHKSRPRFEYESICLDDADERPLFRQLEDHLRAAIHAGTLTAGQKLPSSRQLAKTLGVARNTVINAYDQLASEGYLQSIHGSGTSVTCELPNSDHVSESRARNRSIDSDSLRLELSKYGQLMKQYENFNPDAGYPKPFRPHMPALDLFPTEAWKKLTVSQVRRLDPNQLSGVDPQGYRPLRRAIAEYMLTSRGVNCGDDQVLITSGAQQGLALIAQLLLDAGDNAAIEDPGYSPARQIFDLAGLKTVSVDHDEDGISIDSLSELPKQQRPKLIYTTPGGQWPIGMTMSLARRMELLGFAESNKTWVIEDDYNGEFRYVGRRLPALTSLDNSGRVIYMGSFSKLTFPAIRLGFLILPKTLTKTFSYARWLNDRFSPSIWQMVLCRFIETGQFLKHLQRMRVAYADRQESLCTGLDAAFGNNMRFTRQPSGMHLTVFGRTKKIEQRLVKSAKEAAVDFHPVSLYTHDPKKGAGLILGFAAYTKSDTLEAIQRWRECFDR
ncbi:PLP-dependent aminotransferase family protein [Stieleria sp. JC731]|uniref:MocR-like pyridoxine biosynthesis transcription factor PdxR n=1 Tax=Pirellulaceae TaxID=2691357 RepID=UPI001E58FC29|nr:PLP-dependent aminotransferase family protein [Stieleria sp. JC731]MCC9603311.1 PLP-dependent aminotransferase family protein [Stieleria sp. JC731]